jgi:hypothetical protein
MKIEWKDMKDGTITWEVKRLHHYVTKSRYGGDWRAYYYNAKLIGDERYRFLGEFATRLQAQETVEKEMENKRGKTLDKIM